MEREVKLFTEEIMRDMGKRIQVARKNKGFKALEFADIIGIGKDQLSRIENGKVACKIDYLFVISKLLDVSCDYLLYGECRIDDELEIERMLDNMSSKVKEKALKILAIISE